MRSTSTTPPPSALQQPDLLRQAAIVVAALGEDLAKEVCSRLPASQVLALGDELAALQEVSAAELNQALAEFMGRMRTSESVGGPAYARSVLSGALGYSGGGRRTVDHAGLTVLSRLNDLDPKLLWRIISEERPQTIAALVTNLSPAKAGQLLGHLDGGVAADIAHRAARLGVPSPGTMKALGEALELELRAARADLGDTPEVSVQFLVDFIGSMPPDRGKQVLQALQEVDKALGDGVAEQLFTFEDLSQMSDGDLQIVLRAVDTAVLVTALKGTAPELREQVKRNLSQRGRERLEEEFEMLGA
ncbi:MAG: FliG C-terminal domain-containing protein, partial [Armatimonadota bacterium]